jgi:hypothetical protein
MIIMIMENTVILLTLAIFWRMEGGRKCSRMCEGMEKGRSIAQSAKLNEIGNWIPIYMVGSKDWQKKILIGGTKH